MATIAVAALSVALRSGAAQAAGSAARFGVEPLAVRALPSGSLLVTARNAANGLARVYLVDAQSGQARILADNVTLLGAGAPVISPDGQYVALAADEGKRIMLVDRDGAHERLLSAFPPRPHARVHGYVSAAFSPDSKSLVVSEASGHVVVIRRISGGAPHVLVRERSGNVIADPVTWSPNGRWIGYQRVDFGAPNSNATGALHLIRANGRNDHMVLVIHDVNHDIPTVTWSHDSRTLALVSSDRRDARDPAYAILDAASGHVTLLPGHPLSADFSPDDRQLAGVDTRTHQLLITYRRARDQHQFGTILEPREARFSADGAWLFATTSNADGTASNVELVSTSGATATRVLFALPAGWVAQELAYTAH
jgi:Tol biopolymer transport system component